MFNTLSLLKSASIIVAVFFTLAFCAPAADAQQIVTTVDKETYQQALDLVFPMKPDENSFDYGYFIRVRPSFDEEYLIKIIANRGKIIFTKYKSLNGNLYSFFSDLVEEEQLETPQELAQKVKLKEETKVLSETQFSRLRKEFAQKIFSIQNKDDLTNNNQDLKDKDNNQDLKDKDKDKNRESTIILDGTVYEVKYTSSDRETSSFWVYDHPIQARTFDSPIPSWIKNVQEVFENVRSRSERGAGNKSSYLLKKSNSETMSVNREIICLP